jgi:hypothetical protein
MVIDMNGGQLTALTRQKAFADGTFAPDFAPAAVQCIGAAVTA